MVPPSALAVSEMTCPASVRFAAILDAIEEKERCRLFSMAIEGFRDIELLTDDLRKGDMVVCKNDMLLDVNNI